jgi:hypothetical protein
MRRLLPLINTTQRIARWGRGTLQPAAVFALYLLIAIVYTRPLLWHLGKGFPNDAGDPSLNASILSWNAARVPFSSDWWNARQFYPTEGVVTFTENLVGFSPFSSPIIWLTGNSIAGYNVALLLTWPLTAFAAYVLVARLTGCRSAAFIAGMALGFNPYRRQMLPHLQMLGTAWLPLMFLGLHGYLNDRRYRWLCLVAVAWVLNSLSNGHFMMFGAVLIALWLAYFGSRPDTSRNAVVLAFTWVAASLPLVPIFIKYQVVHDHFNLHRHESEIIYFSAQPAMWGRVSGGIWLWGKLLPDGRENLFPGVTILALIVAGIALLLWRRRDPSDTIGWRRYVRLALMAGLALSAALSVSVLCLGPWEWTASEVRLLRMTDLNRAVGWVVFFGIALVAMTTSLRQALAQRSPLVFYVAAGLVCALLACGPMLRVGEEVVLSPLPYRWLMAFPAFNEMRGPIRFWMLGVVCLSVAAGVAFSHLRPTRTSLRPLAFVSVVGAVVLDTWILAIPIADPPERWPIVESSRRPEPLLELPIGAIDYPATFRAGEHRRRLVNGVSGYDPPYYTALVEGLQRLDARTLAAIAAFGPLDVVISEDDPNGEIRRYVSSYPGAEHIATDGRRDAYRLPKAPPEPSLGPPLPIVSVRVRDGTDVVGKVHDRDLATGWEEPDQLPDQSVLIDLGTVREVGGLTHALGDAHFDFPRHLAIDASVSGSEWITVWDSPAMGPMVLASIRAPRVADMRIAFSPHPARYIRVRQTESHFRSWRISELSVHAPPSDASTGRVPVR